MLMKFPGFTLKPLAASMRRHRFVPLYAVALGMSVGHVQAADSTQDAATPTSTLQPVDVTSTAVAPVTTQLKRVEVTGSSIRRADAETAVPITILKADDLRKQGVTTTAEILTRIVGSQSTDTSSGQVGSNSGGASFANLRGIGDNKTLVLLNGRRLANNAVSGTNSNGGGVDLNMIPFAAIDRVEILRDGASATYGTDAIGGVINFITKKTLTDGQITFGTETPTHKGGGENKDMSASWGYGDLDQDRFNVMGVFNYQQQQSLDANDRSFTNDFNPGRGVNSTSPTAFPGNYNQGGATSNPAYSANGCNTANLHADPSNAGACRFSTRNYINLLPETEKTSFFGKATGKLAEDHNVSLDYFWSRNVSATTIGPQPLPGLTISPTSPYYPGNGITPLPTTFTLDPTKPVNTSWRETAAGAREESDQNTSQRVVLDFNGMIGNKFVGNWDYDVGATYNQNKVVQSANGGYASDSALTAGLADGTLNPFGDQSAAGQQLINNATYHQDFATAVGRVYGLDGKVSREIGDWFGAGETGIAIGGEYRKELFHQDISAIAGDLDSLGLDPAGAVSGDRSVKAEFGEINVPVLKSLELSAAVRHDKYSDFGSTTNPKYSFRFQPFKSLVTRGAYSEGFRAPTLYELYAPKSISYTAGNYNDPRLCPGGVVAPGGQAGRDCNIQFHNQTGGNTALSPETARNVTLGFVYQPMSNLSMGLDWYWIKIQNQIQLFPEAQVIDNPDTYADRIVRGSDGSITNIVTGLANLGNVKTSGIDATLAYQFPNTPFGQFGLDLAGTYVTRYDFQDSIKGPYTDKVGDYEDEGGGGEIARWKHVLTGTWHLGNMRASVDNRFTTSYNDSDVDTHQRVASYSVWDMSAGYTFNKVLDVDLGMKNIFDRDPPFTNESDTFQSGYDPRYGDPLGRTLYARTTYHF